MAEAGFTSHKAFARAIREVSAEPDIGLPVGCDHTSVSRWLHGMMPRSETAACITTVLSRALARPVSLAELGFAACQAVPLDLGLQYLSVLEDRIETVARLWHADLDGAAVVARPPSGSAWRDVPLNWLLAAQSQTIPGNAAPRVGHPDVQRIRVTTELFSELDGRFGGGHDVTP